ncbi:MAG: ABC transporter permease [Demequina sp.]|jgi:peptide/nickel transport system permease protein|nr:ABC transporter permease [Demequina sp.]
MTESNPGPQVAFALAANETQGMSLGKIVWGRFVRHKAAMISAIVLAVTIIIVLTSIGVGPIPGWWIWSPTAIDPTIVNNGHPTFTWNGIIPSFGEHPFGQDQIGRDVFARTMRGAQVSLLVMILMGIIATFVGVIIGAYSGFYRGRTDFVLQRGTEVVIAIPTIVVTAVIGQKFGSSNPALFGIVLGLLLWPGLTRLVRAEYLSLREREFVDAARVAGAGDRSIMFRHILPNAMGVIIVNATLLMATATILEAALSYLGFGIQPPNVSLGQLINEYQTSFSTRPWLFWWPGFFIIVYALTINLIGDGLRDAFDPRQRRIPKTKELKQQAIVKTETEVAE